MRSPKLSKDLVPVGEFRANLAHLIKQLEDDGRPVVVTQRGRAAAVLVSPDTMDEIEDQLELVRRVLGGLRDVAAGNLVDDDAVWGEVEQTIAEAEQTSARSLD